MATYFLDTSALAKRYHKEIGSEFMDRIVEAPGSRSLISHLSVVEFESVLAIKMRTREIDEGALQLARRRCRADIVQRHLLVAPPIHERHFHRARTLLIQYGVLEGLRTLDALQLAVALDLRHANQIDLIVTADQRLCRVALVAGCPAVNPEKPGPALA